MPTASLSFLTPEALLLCGAALIPVGVLVMIARRQQRVARALRLGPESPRWAVPAAALTAGACMALGVAAAQPVLWTTTTRTVRTESEIVLVVDVSRSMLASARPGGASRLDRAKRLAGRLRAAAPDVPAGISGLTDRVLPYLFPTVDRGVFTATLERSVEVDTPPPQAVATVVTSFATLPSLVRDGYFSRRAKHRTCVLFTDGETRGTGDDTGDGGSLPSLGGGSLPLLGGGSSGSGDVATGAVDAQALGGPGGCRLVVVRVGDADERIYDANGVVEAGYRPEPSASSAVEQLARSAGGTAFTEDEVSRASAAVRGAAEIGPSHPVGFESSVRRLAPFFAGIAALLVIAFAGVHVLRWLRPASTGNYH
jgi:hypothetical protein